MNDLAIIIISSLLGLIFGGLVGLIIRVAVVEKGFQTAKNESLPHGIIDTKPCSVDVPSLCGIMVSVQPLDLTVEISTS